MKNFISISLLAFAFVFIGDTVQAQLVFFNGSPCQIQVKAAAENVSTPCAAPTCPTGTVAVPPGGFVVLPVGPCFVATASLQYRAVKFSMVGGITAAADKCLGPNPAFFVDCQGNPRQLRITSPTFAGIF